MRFDKARLPSRHATSGITLAPQRTLYYGMGLSADDIARPLVGVVTAWAGTAPAGDAPLEIAAAAEASVWSAGATPRQFATVADAGADAGLLVGRELVADGVELTVRGHSYDALVGVAAGEEGLAGLMLVAGRLDVPTALVPLVGPEWEPTPEAAALAAAAEELRLGPGSGEPARAAGALVAERLAAGTGARDRIDAGSLARAAAAALGTGAAPDVVLHLLALAHECGVAVRAEDLVTGDAAVIHGTLAPDGALACGPATEGRARVFEAEDAAAAWVAAGGWEAGTVLAVRGLGPRGAPGMPRLRRLAAAIAAAGAPSGALLVTDARLPRIVGVATVCAVTPEAYAGGPLARLADGDRVVLAAGVLNAAVSGSAVGTRDEAPPAPALAKYRRFAGPAMSGAVTHPGAAGEVVRYREL
jgi:dihydroxyacid dehydratase/phosphogluconate dehydratase